MKSIQTPSFIRVNRELYDGGLNQNGQQVINRIETRYIVLPSDENIEKFPELEIKTLDALREDFSLLSNKISNEEVKQWKNFIMKFQVWIEKKMLLHL